MDLFVETFEIGQLVRDVESIVQPLMATILAIRAGWGDAWEGQPIFFWTLVREPKRTAAMLRNLWTIAGKIFLVAIVLDVIYQIIVFRWVYPVETLIVATVLVNPSRFRWQPISQPFGAS